MSQLQVHLYRDSFSTPWGFRLQGGNDVGQALVIQRVFANSPAEGYLQRGDIILKLNNCEAADLSHKRAQELFNSAGGQVLLTIKRVQYIKKEVPVKPKDPKPKSASVSAPASQKMAPTLTSNRKVGRESSSSAKPKDISYGGGGFNFGLDYSKVKVDNSYVPGPILVDEEAEEEDVDQAYRTVPLELTGPLGASSPKYGGQIKEFGVSYNKAGVLPAEPIMQRQSSKPWEDQEMLHKVQDTLSHISYPYAPPVGGAPPAVASNINCVNMYSSAPAPVMAPPAYVPGPPAEVETNYVDPFPSYKPTSAADEEDEEYEFVPVSKRRNQFNKADFTPQERKPIKPQRAPPVFAPAPPAPAPAPRSQPMTPTFAPMSYSAPAPFMPAEGEVVKPDVPAWAGTLTNVGGPKLWDAGYKPNPINKPGRSGSPTKKAAAQAPVSGEFKPTQTQVLDFSADPEDGPRIMHLQYNSPLDMYSKQNVEETLQGQTQAAMGGGNTVKWLSHVQQLVVEESQPAQSFSPVETKNFRNVSAPRQAPVAKPAPVPSRPQYQSVPSPRATTPNASTLPFTPVSFKPKEIPIPKPLQIPPAPVNIPNLNPIAPQAPFNTAPAYSPPTMINAEPETKTLSSGFLQQKWSPVAAPQFDFLKKNNPPSVSKPPRRVVATPEPVPAPEPEPVYRPWGAVTAVPPPTLKLAKEPEPEVKQVRTPDADRSRVFEELSSALKSPSTFPRGSYAAKEKMGIDMSAPACGAPRMTLRVSRVASASPKRSSGHNKHPSPSYSSTVPYGIPPSSSFAHVNAPTPPPAPSVPYVDPQIPGFSRVRPPLPPPVQQVPYISQSPVYPNGIPSTQVYPQTPRFGHVSAPVCVSHATVNAFNNDADLEDEDEYVSASEPEPEPKPVSSPVTQRAPVAQPQPQPIFVPAPKFEPSFIPELKTEPLSEPAPVPVTQVVSAPEPEVESITVKESEVQPSLEPEPAPTLVTEIKSASQEEGPVTALKTEGQSVSLPESEISSVSAPEAGTVTVQESEPAMAPDAEPVSVQEAQHVPAPQANSTTVPDTEPVPAPEAEPVTVPKSDPAAVPEAEPVTVPETQPVTVLETEAVTVPEAEPVPAPEAEPVTVPESEPATVPEAEPVTVPETQPVTVPEAEAVTVPEAEPVAAPESEIVTVPESEPATVPEAEPVPAPESEPVTVPESEPATVPEAEPVTVQEAEPVSASDADPVSTPKAEPVSAPEAGTDAPQEAQPISSQESPIPPEPSIQPEANSVSEAQPEVSSVSADEPEIQTVPESVTVSESPAEKEATESVSVSSDPVSGSGPEMETNTTVAMEAETIKIEESISLSKSETETIVVQESETICLPDTANESEPIATSSPPPDSQPESVNVSQLEPISIPEPEFHSETKEGEATEGQTCQENETNSATIVEDKQEVTSSNVDEINSSGAPGGVTGNPELADETN